MEPWEEAATLLELSPRSKARKARRDYKEKQKEADPEGWKLKRAAEAKTTYENKKARLAASALATVGSSTTPEEALPPLPLPPPNQPPTSSLPLLPTQPDAALQLTPPPPLTTALTARFSLVRQEAAWFRLVSSARTAQSSCACWGPMWSVGRAFFVGSCEAGSLLVVTRRHGDCSA